MKSGPSKSVNNTKGAKGLTVANQKAIVAGVLVFVMLVMWMRVFLKKKSALPVAVSASTTEQQTTDAQQQTQAKGSNFHYVELPVVSGRNDVLVRDVFSAKAWNGGGINDVVNVTSDRENESQLLQDEIRSIAQNLKLEAIINGNNGHPSEVFLENKLVPTGSDLIVRRNGKKLTFTIESAEGNQVVLKCEDVRVTLKMSNKDEKSD